MPNDRVSRFPVSFDHNQPIMNTCAMNARLGLGNQGHSPTGQAGEGTGQHTVLGHQGRAMGIGSLSYEDAGGWVEGKGEEEEREDVPSL